MREIKFRAWDIEKKHWINEGGTTFTSKEPKEGQVGLLLCGNLRVFCAEYMGEELGAVVSNSEYESTHPCHTEPPYKRQYVLQQFTGLLDKNGKEIYEGDIVKYVDKFGNKTVGEIWFSVANFLITYSVGNWDFTDAHYFKEPIEVIGNIYENPELLKEKE